MEPRVEIAVLYGDLSLKRVSWTEKQLLSRNDVLSIAIINLDQPDKKKRQQSICERDWYVLVWTNKDSHLGGYDDDMYFFSFTEPWKPYGEGFVHRFPYILPKNSMLFEGVMVKPDVYAEAKRILGDRDGEMY